MWTRDFLSRVSPVGRLSLQNMALKVEGGPLAQWSRATQLFTSVPVAWEKQQQSSCPLVLG